MKTKIRNPAIMRQPVEAPDYTMINAALEQHLDLAWTETNQKAIKRKVGPDNCLKIQEIISFTSNQDAWLNDYSVSSAADRVGGKLSQHYPMLSPLAVFKIINQQLTAGVKPSRKICMKAPQLMQTAGIYTLIPEHAQALQILASNPEIAATTRTPHPYPPDGTRQRERAEGGPTFAAIAARGR